MAAVQPGHNDPFGVVDDDEDLVMDLGDDYESQDQQPAGPFLDDPPAPRNPPHSITGTPFAGPYRSVFTINPPLSPTLLRNLAQVNCSYLSTKGQAPTLLQLKQHAQALTILIKELTVSTKPVLINNTLGNPFNENESFDWLNNLNEPYNTDDKHHHMPLTTLLNTLETSPQSGEVRDICPMHHVADAPAQGHTHPYATHAALIKHANSILERLDHEYSAKGGLLSIFPTEAKKEDREKAEKTVLGQLIMWVQNLVQRIHHLERLYANALDVVEKEAVCPQEMVSALGTHGRRGREVVYPQDRFVLVNAGEDVWQYLNSEFERREVVDAEVDKSYRELGVTGEAIWEKRGGKEFAKGITAIDIVTRYYRLRDNPLKTVFIIPAYESHPGVKVTREMERQPSVVTVVKPVWPERLSVLEMKYRSDLDDLKRLRRESMDMHRQIEWLNEEKKLLMAERETMSGEVREAKKRADESERALKQPVNKTKLDLLTSGAAATQMRNEALLLKGEWEVKMAAADKAKADAEKEREEMKKARENLAKTLQERETQQAEHLKQQAELIDNYDKDVARAAQEVAEKLKAVWFQQISDSQVMINYLASRDKQAALGEDVIPEDVQQHGQKVAKELFDKAAQGIRTPTGFPLGGENNNDDGNDKHATPRLFPTSQRGPPNWQPTTPQSPGSRSGKGVLTADPAPASPTRATKVPKSILSPGSGSQPSPTRSTPRNRHVEFSTSLEQGPSGSQGGRVHGLTEPEDGMPDPKRAKTRSPKLTMESVATAGEALGMGGTSMPLTPESTERTKPRSPRRE